MQPLIRSVSERARPRILRNIISLTNDAECSLLEIYV